MPEFPLMISTVGGQSNLQAAANTIAPYAAKTIGNSFGHNGSDPNKTAQLFSHAVLGATLAYVNGGNGAADAVTGAGSEAAAIYLTQTLYKDKANDPATGKLDPNRLPEKDKEHIRSLTAAIGAVAGVLLVTVQRMRRLPGWWGTMRVNGVSDSIGFRARK